MKKEADITLSYLTSQTVVEPFRFSLLKLLLEPFRFSPLKPFARKHNMNQS